MKGDTAILVVSVGTTHIDTLERSIAATERAVAEAFPEYPVYRAFVNTIIIRRLRERHALHIDNVEEALERIQRDGYGKVAIQPTLLLRGFEYELFAGEAEKAKIRTAIGSPLLETESDCQVLASIIMKENLLGRKEALVLMGHGTDHKAGEVYSRMQGIFEEKKYPAFIAAVDGNPSFGEAVERMICFGAQRAKLLPLLFAAGDHAKKDMAGKEDSLFAMTKKAGIEPEPVFRGLGESRDVQALYVKRAKEAVRKLL